MITLTPLVSRFLVLLAIATAAVATPPTEIKLPGDAKSPIAAGVALPAGRALFWTSGTVPSVAEKTGATVYQRYGDTYAQGVSCLKALSAVLAEQGLTLKDVIYLRVYLAPDAAKENKQDYQGWFKAYGEFFNNAQNPAKTARSTVGVQSLVNPDWLIEVEAFAAYPDPH
jgi:enamine deaminase RidA (YjgF/YER057c/UK114 family)